MWDINTHVKSFKTVVKKKQHLSGNKIFSWRFIIWSDAVLKVDIWLFFFFFKWESWITSPTLSYISSWQVEWSFEDTCQIMLLPCQKSSNDFPSHLQEIRNSLFWLTESCMRWPLVVWPHPILVFTFLIMLWPHWAFLEAWPNTDFFLC